MKYVLILFMLLGSTLLFANLQIDEMIDFGYVSPRGDIELGQGRFIVHGSRLKRVIDIENDSVQVLHTTISEHRHYECLQTDSDTLLFPSWRHGVDIYNLDDEGFHFLGSILDDVPQNESYVRILTSLIGDVLFQCRCVVPDEGSEYMLWEVHDIEQLQSPQLIQTVNLPVNRYFDFVFLRDDRYYFVEFLSTVKVCDDLEAFELTLAMPAWPDGQRLLAAKFVDDRLFLCTRYNDSTYLRIYAFDPDGMLNQIAERQFDFTGLVYLFFHDNICIVSGQEDDNRVHIYKNLWEDDQLTPTGQSQMPPGVTQCRLHEWDDGYLAFSLNNIHRLNEELQPQVQILASKFLWLYEVIQGRYLLLNTSSEQADLDNRYVIYDIETYAFLPFETDGYCVYSKFRHNQNHWTFQHSGHIETVSLGDNGIESIVELPMPTTYITANLLDDLACVVVHVDNETLFRLYRIVGDDLVYLNEYNPSYYADTSLLLDPQHIVIMENLYNSLHYHYYRIENDYSLSHVATFPNPLGIYATDTRLAPTAVGSIPIDISDPDNPLAMEEFDLPGVVPGNFLTSYNGNGYFMFSGGLYKTYVTDGDFQLIDDWTEMRAFFLSGNQVVINDGVTLLVGTLSCVEVEDNHAPPLPAAVALLPNSPNPFNPRTSIAFTLAEPAHSTLCVYNIRGRRVATLADEYLQAGEHSVTWTAEGCASGVYFVRLEAAGETCTHKMVLLK
ncbi:MAG: T9SS type A sorting domain-containing protein [Candidatus Cloacimonetes bacterium]|nr:T9SS type A sorting domain-containing protein [Candidatus Cloacimonadota bacterium]